MNLEKVRSAAARRDGLQAREQRHATHPGDDGANAIHDTAFQKRFEWSAQNLEQITKKHSSNIVGDYEHDPRQHSRSEHSHWTIPKACNWNQHEKDEKPVTGGVTFQRVAFEPRQAVRG